MVLLWQAIEGGLSRIPKVLKKYPPESMGVNKPKQIQAIVQIAVSPEP